MAFVPGYDLDVFLSYTHRDNQAPAGDGWVTAFHKRLRIALDGLLGEDAEIFRDVRMGGAAVLTTELESRLRRTALLIAVVSPSYVRSEWCQWELNGFAKIVGASGLVGTSSRAIRVIKTPLDDDADRNAILSGTLGVNFFEFDKESKVFSELEVDTPPYKKVISELAQRIWPILKALARNRTVYLGAAEPGLADQRRKLEQELLAWKYRVVSSQPDAAGEVADDEIRSRLKSCGVAVIFSDSTAGSSPAPDGKRRLADSELRIAAELNVRSVLSAQATAELHPSPAAENVFAAGPRADVLVNKTTSEVKETVLAALNATTSGEPGTDGPKVVYLICDRRDHPFLVENDARRMQEYLNQQGLEVKVPLGEDAPAEEYSKDNLRKLKECDAVLLYWGNASQAWFDERVSELRQARGWRRPRGFATKWAYLTKPSSTVKEKYSTLETDSIVREFDAFAPTTLDPFVRLLGGRREP